jgi:N-acetylglucosamine malate deacetylase 1
VNSKKVIVVAVHPDDETLGCGGTLLRHKAEGDEIYWLIVTNITAKEGWDKKFVDKRQDEIDEVSKRFGFKKTFKLDFPTTRLDQIPKGELITSISRIFNEVKPNIVYLPNRSDVHSDHQITFQAAYSCTKNFRYPFIEKIIMMETISETEFAPALAETAFIPNLYVNIEDYFDKKIEIFNCFESEVMTGPFPRSIETILSLAIIRGSSISKKYAEAFQLLKEIR